MDWFRGLRRSRFLVSVAGVSITVGLLFALGPVASAASSPGAASAARFAASATRYQNDTIARAMARVPGGIRVAANEVEWRHGGMILRVPTSPRARVSTSADHVSPRQSFANCSYSYSCVYSGTGWQGTEYECESSYLAGGQYWCAILYDGFGNGLDVESWVNYTAYRAWLQQYESHTTGYTYCETPRYGNNSPSFSSDFTGSVSVTAQVVWMSNNSASC
jgi:hypothetical protein